ncbi:hypothetical protein [Puia sp.]|jgi:hypothetical protein|uniref:hypothetical protein n=1 Tax=Puia sp. TaxID=2045100 RepID=UPI002F3E816D
MEKILQILVVFALIMLVVNRFIRGREQRFREYVLSGHISLPLPGDLYRELLSVVVGEDVIAADPDNRLFFRPGPENTLVAADKRTGVSLASVAMGEEIDAVLFDPLSRLIYCYSLAGLLTVLRQSGRSSYRIVQRMDVPRGGMQLSLDPHSGKIYLQAEALVYVYAHV